jgi:hypothetical protein
MGQRTVRVPAPLQQGVPVGGPFEFLVTQVPASIQAVSCQVTLELAAPSGHVSKHVSLPAHVVSKAAPKGEHGCKVEVASRGGLIKEEREEVCEGGSGAYQPAVQPDVLPSTASHPPKQEVQGTTDIGSSSTGTGWQAVMAARDSDVDAALATAGLRLPAQAPEHVIAALKAKIEQQQQPPSAHSTGTGGNTEPGSSSRAVQQAEVVATGPGLSVCTFVSQAAWYDPQAVWDKFVGKLYAAAGSCVEIPAIQRLHSLCPCMLCVVRQL